MNPIFYVISTVLHDNNDITKGIKIYAFGSAIRSDKQPNDIDILIIYVEDTQPKVIRRLLDNMGNMPLHLIFMFPQEELETNFIRAQKCVEITALFNAKDQ